MLSYEVTEMKGKIWLGLALVAVIGEGAGYAHTVQEFSLEPLVVTATRSEKRDVDVPASTITISNEELKATGAENLQVALGYIPGLVYKSFAPGGGAMGTMANDIAIRGVNNGTLVLVNGVPFNLRGKYYLDAIPLEMIDHVEIIRGAGSVLYGSEAMGGVINIITKKTYHNSITAGIGNYGQEQYSGVIGNGTVGIGYHRENWGKVGTISRSYDKGTKHTDMEKSHKDSLFLTYALDENWDFLYSYYETNVAYQTWFDEAYKEVPAGGAFQQGRDYTTKQHMAQLTYHDDTVRGNIYYNQNKIIAQGPTLYTSSGKLSSSWYDKKEKNRTYGLDVQKKWDRGEKGSFLVGTTFQNEFYDDLEKKNRSIYSRNNYAVYGQYDYAISDKNEIIVGARETWTGGAYRNQNYHNFSMSGAFIHKIKENEAVYANATQSFIMPSFSQMYAVTDASIPNPDLVPQKGMQYEVGWKKQGDGYRVKTALYHIAITDNISAKWNTDQSQYQYTNEDFTNTGIEISGEIEGTKGFSYTWGLSYGNPKAKKKDFGWDRTYGRIQVNGGVHYRHEKWNVSVQGVYLADRVESPSAKRSFKEKPYLLTSADIRYAPNKTDTVRLSLNNLLDREDNVGHSGSVYYAAPFHYTLSYEHRF